MVAVWVFAFFERQRDFDELALAFHDVIPKESEASVAVHPESSPIVFHYFFSSKILASTTANNSASGAVADGIAGSTTLPSDQRARDHRQRLPGMTSCALETQPGGTNLSAPSIESV